MFGETEGDISMTTTLQTPSLTETMKEWHQALTYEITHWKTIGGSKLSIINGRFLYTDYESTVYVFQLISEVSLPDGTPIRIEFDGEEATGEVLSVHGLEIELKLNDYIQGEIREAILYSEPWQLLEQLQERLKEVRKDKQKRQRVKRLLDGNSTPKHIEKMKNPKNELAYRSFYNATTYVWGPPGTGKSYNLSRIISAHYQKGKSVLVLAHSNAAVDVLMSEVTKQIEKKEKWTPGEIVRYGFSQHEHIRNHETLLASRLVETTNESWGEERLYLEELRQELRQKILSYKATASEKKRMQEIEGDLRKQKAKIKEVEREYIENAKVIGATLSKCAIDSLIYERNFDLIIVDEVSMAYVPQIALAASLGKRIVVCGDFLQLPPIALANHELVTKWLKEDMFYHAGIVDSVNHRQKHPNLFMLQEQRRMHPEISSFTNSFIYNNRVFDHPSVSVRKELAELQPFANEATALFDTSLMGAYSLKDASSGSRFNILSGLMAMQLVLIGLLDGMPSIGVVTPYRAQARFLSTCIRELLQKTKLQHAPVLAATVHKFQGSERDMMLFDTVDSYPSERPGVLFFDHKNHRLVNVAVTRARGKFIQLSDCQYMRKNLSRKQALSQLTAHLQRQGNVYDRTTSRPLLERKLTKRLRWFVQMTIEEPKALLKDILSAKQKIIVSLPSTRQIDKRIWQALARTTAQVTIYSEGTIPLKNAQVCRKNKAMPFVLIDDEVLWAGAPLTSNVMFEGTPEFPYITARLQAPETIGVLKGFLDVR
ncbi:AAA domain-containing protein [Bacillus sp. DX1.1]|uniref:AAA domain-containing protein n=1 Tax=unclassified Bacillus (in: firmicutes) TaxID=185979 RepID=UPI00256FD6DB|nr:MULTISPECIES: AAA domain-containing protein [unclassified Bacillus (in: firmicutes)]MDM5155389.1 AAA domain-containing protein [Bacillus sp. DX1.1]WJE79704.1 AAA domain-containing protein [Bacillus sp. DX3.1]